MQKKELCSYFLAKNCKKLVITERRFFSNFFGRIRCKMAGAGQLRGRPFASQNFHFHQTVVSQKLAVRQSLFQTRVISLANNLATMFNIEALKFVGKYLTTTTQNSEWLLPNTQPLSKRERSLNTLALLCKVDRILQYATISLTLATYDIISINT